MQFSSNQSYTLWVAAVKSFQIYQFFIRFCGKPKSRRATVISRWGTRRQECYNHRLYVPSKHFSVVSTLFLGWYDVMTWRKVKSTLKLRWVSQCWNLQRWTTSNQRCPFQRWFKQRQTTWKQRYNFQRRFSQRWPFVKNKN